MCEHPRGSRLGAHLDGMPVGLHEPTRRHRRPPAFSVFTVRAQQIIDPAGEVRCRRLGNFIFRVCHFRDEAVRVTGR